MKKSALISLGVIVALSAAVCFFGNGSGESSETDGGAIRSRVVKEEQRRRRAERQRQVRLCREERMRQRQDEVAVRERPNVLELEDEGDLKISELAMSILREIQIAMGRNDFPAVRKLVLRLMHGDPRKLFGSARIPTSVKRKMIEALGWFGAEGLAETVEFMVDAEPEIVDTAVEQFEDAFWDPKLSDRDRSVLVVTGAKMFSESTTLDWIMSETYDMRNSVAIGTILEVMKSGSDAAKAQIPEVIEGVTGLNYLKTEEDLTIWLEDWPDEPNDEQTYAGVVD